MTVRQRDAIIEELEGRGVTVTPYLGTNSAFVVRGHVTLSLRGLVDIWRQLYPGQPLPPPKQRCRP